MEAQIQQAVEIASSASSDPVLKEQALSFITQLKSSDDGWKPCLKLLQLELSTADAKFFALQVISERLPYLTDNDKLSLKDMIFAYLSSLVTNNKIEPFFLRNALSKTLGLIFVHYTLNCYSTLIKDLLSLSYNTSNDSFNEIATDYYLRTLLVIHQEIGDQLITRDNRSQDQNNLLKDAIRECDMLDLTNIWKKILYKFTNNTTVNKNLSDEIINNTILCIGSYVSWIEINLILDDEYMSFLYQFLSSNDNSKRRMLTANTFNEILHKKMPPVKKLELLNFLNLGTILSQLNLNSKAMEFDVAMALAKLVNQIGDETVILLDHSSPQELMNNDFRNLACSKILEIFPLIFEFLSNEFDDISLEVFPFISSFFLLLKKNITNESIDFSALNNDEILTTLSKNLILKLKFDPDDDGDDDETIEQFNEIRNKLKVFLDSIVLLNETLALEVFINCINEFLFSTIDSNKNKEIDWRTIELGLYILTYYSDMLRNNVMNLPKTMINNSRPYFVFNEMLCKVIDNSNIILISHPLIQLLFFELLLKHYSFFNNNNIQVEGVNKDGILMKVLNIFISNFGVFSVNEKVKYRSWYLFYRFIKMTKPKISDFIIEELIKSLLPLLNFTFDIISNKNKSTATNSVGNLQNLDLSLIEETGSFENQLYLFESVGLLITLISNEDSRITILENVLQPLFRNLESGISTISSSELNLNILIRVHHSLVSIGNLLKGFEGLKTDQLNNVKFLNILNQISQVVVITLENFIDYNIIRECIQFCTVRLFIVLNNNNITDKELLQTILSKFITCIMVNFDKLMSLEIINFINFVSQILHQTSANQNLYLLLNSLLTPFLGKIFYKIENDQSKVSDDFSKKEVLDLQRSVMSMIIAISNDHLNSLWLTSENKEMLTNVINMMLNYSYNYNTNDFSVVKLSLLVLNMLCQGIGSGIVIDPQDNFQNSNNKFEQVDEILINNCILLSTELGLKVPAANKELLKDAQFRNNVTLETCRLLKGIAHIGFEYPDANTLLKKKGDTNGATNSVPQHKHASLPSGFNEVKCQQISNTLINNLGFPADLANELVQTLVNSTDRQFLKYLVALVEKF
jgi:exportin-T